MLNEDNQEKFSNSTYLASKETLLLGIAVLILAMRDLRFAAPLLAIITVVYLASSYASLAQERNKSIVASIKEDAKAILTLIISA